MGFWRLRGCAPRDTRPFFRVRRAAAKDVFFFDFLSRGVVREIEILFSFLVYDLVRESVRIQNSKNYKNTNSR